MDDDCLRLILQHACQRHVASRMQALHVASAGGWDDYWHVEDTIMRCDGWVGHKETAIVPSSCVGAAETDGMCVCRADRMVSLSNPEFALCLVDEFGDERGVYDEDRAHDGVHRDEAPDLLPCLGWGVKRTLTYSIQLSKAVRASWSVEVVVVPTSLWIEECEGEWWGVQVLTAACRRHLQIPCSIGDLRCGCTYYPAVAGWAPLSAALGFVAAQ